MRITILQGAFLPVPALRGGAVEKVWLALGREFVRLGHEVCHVSRLCDDLPADEIIDGVYHRRVPGFDAPESLTRLKWYDLLFTRRAVAVLPDADLIVTNTFWAPVLVKPRHGRIWVHVQRYPRHQMNFYFRAAQLQAVSTVIAQAIIKQAPRLASRVSVIPNPLPPVAKTPMAAKKDPNMILFVGRVHPEKGLDLLISANVVPRLISAWSDHGNASSVAAASSIF
jgi:glycosyltransferase involved in cell wall biosynthesis